MATRRAPSPTPARRAAGKFELASGGTLFLDEIGDLSLGGQAKLLRVLEEKVVVRVGGSRPIHTDARVIAATNQNLGRMVRQKRFREDLYFRLNVVTLELPPLRERGDDILLLAEHFLQDSRPKLAARPPKWTPDAKKRLLAHPWPGNVRELRNLMERLAYLSPGDKIEAGDWRSSSRRAMMTRRLRLGSDVGRRDTRLPDRIHPPPDRPLPRQHDGGRRKAGPAPLEPLPQNAAARHGGERRLNRHEIRPFNNVCHGLPPKQPAIWTEPPRRQAV